jgi:hypothetical protein
MIDHKIDIVHAHGTRANSNIYWATKSWDYNNLYRSWVVFSSRSNPLVKTSELKMKVS